MRFACGLSSFLLLLALGATANGDEKNVNMTTSTTTESADHIAMTTTTPLNELPPIGLSESLEKLLGEPVGQLLEEMEVENHSATDDPTGGARAQEPFDLAQQLTLALADNQRASLDEFHAVNSHHRDVKSLVEQFMHAYQAEVAATNLDADMLHVIKAEVRVL